MNEYEVDLVYHRVVKETWTVYANSPDEAVDEAEALYGYPDDEEVLEEDLVKDKTEVRLLSEGEEDEYIIPERRPRWK